MLGNKNICFIANYDKTYFFNDIAKELEKNGVNIFWIVVNKNLNDYLIKNYKKENILYLNKSIKKSKPINEYKINELIQSDRILREDKSKGKVFLESIQKPVYDFLDKNNISFVFGELTWAHEVLIYRISNQQKELNCKFLNPHTIRIPNGRFAFFEDEFQSKIYSIKNNNKKENTIKLEKPDYLKLNDKLIENRNKLSSKLKVFKKFVFNEGYYDKFDPTLYENKLDKLKLKLSEKRKRKIYHQIIKEKIVFLNDKKFILFPLHKQPEASVDVFGRYYENQLQIIENLWRVLPASWYLVIKEHTNAIGDRNREFYDKVLTYPNVIFIDEKSDSHELIDKSEAVFTITGTVAYEAALLNKQSFTFAPTFFNRFSCCHRILIEDFRNMKNLVSFIEEKDNEQNEVHDRDIQEYIINNSFVGLISDPISDSRCMHDENIDNVSEGFRKIISE